MSINILIQVMFRKKADFICHAILTSIKLKKKNTSKESGSVLKNNFILSSKLHSSRC